MLVESFPVGAFQCNCTVLACERTHQAVIVDPGDEAARILDVVRSNGLEVVALLHTHAHLDHVGATGELQRETGAEIGLHEGDRWLYDNVPLQGQMFGFSATAPPPVDRWLEHGEVVTWGDTGRFEVIHTPGHTPGSLCFHAPELDAVFTGDTLFQRSIGRTDLWGGSHSGILESIRERLFPLAGDTVVIPGHGPATSIGDERIGNPFVNE